MKKKRRCKRNPGRWRLLLLILPAAVLAAITWGYFSGEDSELPDQKITDRQKTKSNPGSQTDTLEREGVVQEPIPDETEMIEEHQIRGIVAIDPGHQGSWVDMSESEPNAPGSDIMKMKATTGTQGRFTGINEYELNLDISMMLAQELEKRGYQTVLTRTDNDTAISNAERAVLANESGADFMIRIHANGSEDAGVNGALAMAPGADNPYVGNLSDLSTELARDILDAYCNATGMVNQGVLSENTMTGINWSQIPVMILEMGFMTNELDDTRMADATFREQMVRGIADGVDIYYTKHPSSVAEMTGESSPELDSLAGTIRDQYLDARKGMGEKWAVKIQDLTYGKSTGINSDTQMHAASVIKLFIMATVYDRVYDPPSADSGIYFPEAYEGELEELVGSMIMVSDNESANTIVERLGGGSFENGMAVVNAYCKENGYSQTSMGRRFLGSNANGDNYTSANDCTSLVSAIYEGTCVNAEVSAKMLEYMKNQTRLNKIPSGIASTEVVTANKTGELSDGQLGFVENDVCIVWGREGIISSVYSVMN